MVIARIDGNCQHLSHLYGQRRFNHSHNCPFGAVVAVLDAVPQTVGVVWWTPRP